MPVALPLRDWAGVVAETRCSDPAEAPDSPQQPSCAGPYALPGGVTVHIVEAVAQLPAALAALRASMRDALVAIDLEWRPDFGGGRGQSRVALLQLASSSVAVLVRHCKLPRGQLPPALSDFLRWAAISSQGRQQALWATAEMA